MGVFRPQYNDQKTGELKRTKVWYYKFIFAGRIVKESTKSTSKTVAKEAEKKRRRELEEGYNGILDVRDERIRSIRDLAKSFLKEYKIRQPKSASFAMYAVGHIERLVGSLMAIDVTDKIAVRYQTARLAEGAAPKTINEEVGFLLRLLNVAQAGAIRAQLKQQKTLKLKVPKRVGKAYSDEERTELLKAAKARPRAKGIYFATLLAQGAGLRDKEIRTLQWSRLNLVKRMITVGETKSDAGTGRTIPMSEDLFAAAVEYSMWYTGRFGSSKPEWYVFPFGKPRAVDPTRPQTSMKTAWRNARAEANVSGRFHDNRHTFVTDLAESGAGDQMIQDLAGHVSKDMVKHYSHIRSEAKRRAVEAIGKATGALRKATVNDEKPVSEALVQDSVQASRPN